MSHLTAKDFAILLGLGNLQKREDSPTPQAHVAALIHLLSCARCRSNVSATLLDLQLPDPAQLEEAPPAGDDPAAMATEAAVFVPEAEEGLQVSPLDPYDAAFDHVIQFLSGSRDTTAMERERLEDLATCDEGEVDLASVRSVGATHGRETQEDENAGPAWIRRILYTAIGRISTEKQRQHSPEAALLAQALLDLPSELRLSAIESQARFRNPDLPYTLLELARASHDPHTAGHLARLAGSLLRFQTATARKTRAEALVSCLMADAERSFGKGDLAEDIFQDAAQALRDLPLVLEERAFLCRSWATLRQEQQRTDEALALLERASTLAEELREFHELALSRLACGWLLLDENETERAIQAFREAYALCEQGEDLQAAFAALQGQALAFAELGDSAGLEATLADLHRLLQRLPDPLDTIRVRWIRAKAEARLGNSDSAISEMEVVVESLLRLGPGYEAAQAAFELALLVCESLAAKDDPPPPLPEQIKQLSNKVLSLPHDRLAPHLRPAIEFALKFPMRREGAYLTVLMTAPRYLEKARLNADYPYHPIPEADRILAWRDLTLIQRQNAAKAAGIPIAELDQNGHPKSFETLLRIAWTHEALTGTRLQLPAKEA